MVSNLEPELNPAKATSFGPSLHNCGLPLNRSDQQWRRHDISPNGAPSKSVRTTYGDFLARAERNAQLVRQISGISPGTVVLLHFDQHSDNLDWFWATTLAGYLPAISTPFVNDHDQRRKHLTHLHNVFENPVVLTKGALVPEFLDVGQLRIHAVESLGQANGHANGIGTGVSDQVPNGTQANSYNSRPRQARQGRRDPAVLMLTSGSTGNAKAVCIRHDQIIQSVKGKSQHFGLSHNDTLLNWVGMDHVANLIEMHLAAMYLCAEQVHVQASDLLLEPLTFLRLVDKHRVSYTFAPNFFLALLKRALSGVEDMTPIDVDLSCLKTLMCGGEANVRTLAALTEELHRFGARGEFLRPGFGMTETCAGAMYGKDCPSYELERGLEFSAVGTCIPGIEMRVTKQDGSEAEADEVGDLQTFGPIVFRDYYNNSKATEDSFSDDGWFKTGDKAYIDKQGNLNLTGRSKETIVINGVKHFPYELETAIEESFIA